MRLCYLLAALAFSASIVGCAPDSNQPALGSRMAAKASHLTSSSNQGERGGIGVLPSSPLMSSSPSGVSSLAATRTIDPMRSLAVTEKSILDTFSFEDVLTQLTSQLGSSGVTTPSDLFAQWWSTARESTQTNPPNATGPFCDNVDAGVGQVNGFNYTCPRQEGEQVNSLPFKSPATNPDSYLAVGIFNRFDLAPDNGENCGEYRIVFAKRSGISNLTQRNFIIFEAVLPNPTPADGLKGCIPVTDFWEGLTNEPSESVRATLLHDFFFVGLKNPNSGQPNFLPVIHIDNYGVDTSRTTGQIRTNQFMQTDWNLREFKLSVENSDGGGPRLVVLPVTDKVNPAGLLFESGSGNPLAARFQSDFLDAVKGLAVNDVNLFNYQVGDVYNSGQSVAEVNSPPTTTTGQEVHYASHFSPTGAFASDISVQLANIGSSLTPSNIVARAQALSCAGCHRYSSGANLGGPDGGIVFPKSLGFTHTSEIADGGTPRYGMSPALVGEFLPHRQKVFEDFLNRCWPKTCADLGADCGQVGDGCGGTISCGSCSPAEVCGGGGVANACGCEDDSTFCARLGKNCGSVTGLDNCGQPRTVASCGTCASPDTCGAIVSGVCGCVPTVRCEDIAGDDTTCRLQADSCGVRCGTMRLEGGGSVYSCCDRCISSGRSDEYCGGILPPTCDSTE